MIEVRIFYRRHKEKYERLSDHSAWQYQNLLRIIHWVTREQEVLLSHEAVYLTTNSTRII
jgi:hypothetical protein